MSTEIPDESAVRPPGSDAPDADEAAEAAQDAVEPERLLPGEDERTPHMDDAQHWMKVYGELLDFKRRLLMVTDERLVSMGDAARAEVEDTDLKILRAEADRLERRFDFWTARAAAMREPSS
ncbi:MAG TPA: hypothetical protein VMU65_03575 [Candidatus Saccharimonadales bacterium]|nr:hypothetical protein [Candidatus Saccharimonadales bacterium]